MKASVIIPAYNAKQFIEGAIRSITATPPSFDYEIVVVDDGSTDGTRALLSRLSEELPVLRVYEQENAGPAAARNLGLEMARGEYILFCDSDDVFVPGALQRAVDLSLGEDLLVFGYFLVQDGERRAYRVPDEVLSEPETWRESLGRLYGANMLNQVWGKVFSARLLREKNIRFPLLFWGEDRLFLFQVLREAKRVKVSGESLYDYVQQKNSLISRFIPEKPEICQRIHREICDLAREKGGNELAGDEIFGYMYLKSLLSSLTTLYSPSCSLSGREKRAFCKTLLSQPQIGTVSSFPPDCGRAFRILGGALQGGNVTLNLLLAWGVALASRISPALFRRAKHAYNNKEKE